MNQSDNHPLNSPTKKPLGLVDHVFLLLENKNQPMYGAGICVFDKPDDENFCQRLIEGMDIDGHFPVYPFNKVLHQRFFWKTVQDFDVNRHFFYHQLAKNSPMSTALEYISKRHQILMNREYPLWEFHIIDNIADGDGQKFVVYMKIHHCMVDGIAGMRLLERAFLLNPEAILNKPFWAISKNTSKKSVQKSDASFLSTLKSTIATQVATLKPVTKQLLARHQDRRRHELTTIFDAPKSIFNQKINRTRAISVRSFDKAKLSKLAKQYHATTNDMVLTLCAGAIRRYLLQQGCLPDKPLVGFVPISLRTDESISGNQLSFLLTNLATDEACPKTRLERIKGSINDGKRRFLAMNSQEIINYSVAVYGAAGINLATRLLPTRQGFNLIISNIPNKADDMYLNGAKLNAVYPASVLFDGQALNITLTNCPNKLDVCITACPDVLTDAQVILDFLDDEIDGFE